MRIGSRRGSIRIAFFMILFAAICAFILVALKLSPRLMRLESVISMRLLAVGCSARAATTGLDYPSAAGATIGFAYPIAAANRRFVDQNGNVYLLRAMSSWALAQRCPNTAITSALESLKSLGFNAVTVAPFGIHLNWSFGDRYANGFGQTFFTGAPYASAFGPAWSSMDWIVEEATRLQMTIVFSLFVSFGDTGTARELISAGSTNAYDYGKMLALRYAQYPNIVWHVEGDFEWSASDSIGQQVDAVFHGIKDGEGSNHHLIIAEQKNGLTGYKQFILSEGGKSGYKWFLQSANTLYNYGSNSVELFDAVYGESGAVDYGVIDIEPPYVNSPHYGGNKDQQYRERNYSVFLRGGTGINYGHEKWWPFGAAGIYDGGARWFELVSEAPQLQAKYAWSLIESYVTDPTWTPDDGKFVRSGVGDGDTKAASGYSRFAAVAYFPTGRPVTVDTTAFAGPISVKLSWYDPTTGSYGTISESEAARADRPITFPESHADGSSDWVLVVERS
jgi:hypothetical protein